MPTGVGLQAKVSAVIRRVGAYLRPVYLRQTTMSGGNSTLGLSTVNTVTDTLIDPQPVVDLLKAETIALSAGLYRLGDYQFTMAGESVTEAQLNRSQLIYGSEVLQIIHYEPYPFDQTVAAWSVVGRSVKAGS